MSCIDDRSYAVALGGSRKLAAPVIHRGAHVRFGSEADIRSVTALVVAGSGELALAGAIQLAAAEFGGAQFVAIRQVKSVFAERSSRASWR
jgi:hypothetical protein